MQFQFEWDDAKAVSNLDKHGVSFELGSSIFGDAFILTVPDLGHSDVEERWISIGRCSDGSTLTVVYLWDTAPNLTTVRLISARKSTKKEIRYYQEGA